MTGLTWPIKTSFLDYVRALPDGRIEATGGAEELSVGFVFAESGDVRPDRLDYRGHVTIAAHDGAMDVLLADPSIIHEAGEAWLECTTREGRLRVARLLDCPPIAELAAGGDIPDVALTIDGSAWLGDVYRPWARMAPIVIR